MKRYEIVKETIKATAIEFDPVFADSFDMVTESVKEVVFSSSVFADDHMIDDDHETALFAADAEFEAKGYNEFDGTARINAIKKIGDTYTYYYRTVADV